MTFLSTSALPSPNVVRNTLSAKRKLRLRQSTQHLSIYHSPLFQEWGSSSISSQLLVDGSFAKRHAIRDFAVDIIDLVSSANIPTVWALDSKAACSTENSVPNDVMKCLASQILTSNNGLMDEKFASLSARRFQSARTEKEWFSLLGAVMEGLQQVYLVIDLDLVDRLGNGDSSWLSEFPRLFDRLRERGVKTVVKVVFLRATKSEGEDREVPQKTWHIQIPRRETGRVKKTGAKRGRKRKGRVAEVLQPIIEGSTGSLSVMKM